MKYKKVRFSRSTPLCATKGTRLNKKGFIGIEWVITAAIIIPISIMFFWVTFPEMMSGVLDTGLGTLNGFMTVIGTPGGGGDNFIEYPVDSDRWTDASYFDYANTSGYVVIKGFASGVTAPSKIVIPKEINSAPVTTIQANAFMNKELIEVVLPDGLTTIGNNAFRGNKLSVMSIPDSVTSIGVYAFANNRISNLSLPKGITAISDYAFYDNKIARLTLPGAVTSIGQSAFLDNNLTKLDIHDVVTTIGTGAFKGNILSDIIIGSGVANLADGAFIEQRSNGGTVKVLGANDTLKARFDTRWTSIFKIAGGTGKEFNRKK